MHSRSKQLQPIDNAEVALLRATAAIRAVVAGRLAALAAGTLGFFCLMPYAAVAYGNRSAVQVGNLLALVMVLPCLMVPWRRVFWVYPILLAPLCVSVFKVAVSAGGGGDPALALKDTIVWGLTCLILLPVQHNAPRLAPALLTGAALATLVHVAVGLAQWYSFTAGQFPLLWLYDSNPSFLSVTEFARDIARYVRRPFGIFPEPSAMTASLAPFVLFWIAHLCGLVRLRQPIGHRQKTLFAIAAAGGLGLMILSQSGHAAVTLAAAAVFVAVWFAHSPATTRSYLAIVFVFVVVLPAVLWFASNSLSDRIVGMSTVGNSSWEERSDSLRIGLSLLLEGNVQTTLFGLGAGHSAPAMWRAARIDAVFSVLLSYLYETGVIGLLAVAWVGRQLIRAWRGAGGGLVFPAIAGVWLVGITLTTSYQQLLSLWVVLAWLTVWPEVCQSVPAAAATMARPLLDVHRFAEVRADAQETTVQDVPRRTRWRQPPAALPAPGGE